MDQEDPDYPDKSRRVRLVNTPTMVLLALAVVWALWLVAPNKVWLLTTISRASNPEIAVAFLQAMHSNDGSNHAIILLLAEQWSKLGEWPKAIDLLKPLVSNKQLAINKDESISRVYLELLYRQSVQTKNAADKGKLDDYLNSNAELQDFIVARYFADVALAIGKPGLAHQFLKQHINRSEVGAEFLIDLVLQASDYAAAIGYQQEIYSQAASVSNLSRLMELNALAGQVESNWPLLLAVKAPLADKPDFLQLALFQASKRGETKSALDFSRRLLAIQPSQSLLLSTSELAFLAGDNRTAISLQEKAFSQQPDIQIARRLHQFYLWQGKIPQALAMSHWLSDRGGSAEEIRQGIEEARAMTNLMMEAKFYDLLALENKLLPKEYDLWLNALEKARGTDFALESVAMLAQMRPGDSQLMAEKARLFGYLNQYQQEIRQWRKLQTKRELNHQEAQRFADAFFYTGEPEQALAVLVSAQDWLHAPTGYLNYVASLAWQQGNQPVVSLAYERLYSLDAKASDLHRYVVANTPNDKTQEAEFLSHMYNEYGDSALLQRALGLWVELQNPQAMKPMLAKAQQQGLFQIHSYLWHYQALLSIWEMDDQAAYTNFDRALAFKPISNAALVDYFWWLMGKGDKTQLEQLYTQFKWDYRDTDELWPVFAAAAQNLEKPLESKAWYQAMLKDNANIDVATLLNYATVLEQLNQHLDAYKIRQYCATKMQREMLQLQDSGASYRSLVATFIGPRAAFELSKSQALSAPDKTKVVELLQHYLAEGKPDTLAFWHQRTALKQYPLPEHQQLSLALMNRDKDQLELLVQHSLDLPQADRNLALQQLANHHQAWQEAEASIGTMVNTQAESKLRRAHVAQHPSKTHGIRSQFVSNASWNINKWQLDYFAPLESGYWRLGSDIQRASLPESFAGKGEYTEYRLRASMTREFVGGDWKLGLDLARGIGDPRLGLKASVNAGLPVGLFGSLDFGLANHSEFSQALTLAGKDDKLGMSIRYPITARETLNFRFTGHQLSSRFDDDIARGWQLGITASEQLFFNDPAWMLYGDWSSHQFTLNDDPLAGVNNWLGGAQLTSRDFISPRFQRLSMGTRIYQGAPGLPGATSGSPRFWFDTSLGYRADLDKVDMALNTGLGWRVLGDDELFFSLDWQSQDRNGLSSFKFSLGYYMGL